MNLLEFIIFVVLCSLTMFVGIDAAFNVLCWLTIGCFIVGVIGEFVIQPYRDHKLNEHKVD